MATMKTVRPASDGAAGRAKDRKKIARLKQQLEDAESCLDAIRKGEVDALVIQGPRGEQIYTLKEADRPYRLIVEKMKEGAVVFRPDGLILYANKQFASFLGMRLEALLGGDLLGLADPASLEGLRILVEKAREAGASGDVEFRKASGGRLLTYLSLAPLAIDGVQALSGVALDITEERKIREERTRLAAAVTQSVDGVLILDPGGKIVYGNPACQRITGYPASELVGFGVERYAADMISDVSGVLKTVGIWKGHVSRPRKNGSPLELDVSVAPLRTPEGAVSNYIIQFRDIHHRLELEKKVRQMERTEALGRLAGGVAHDLNNILMPIIVNAELLLDDAEPGSQQQVMLKNLLQAAHRQKALVSRILTFTRQSQPTFAAISMGPLVDEALTLLKPSLPALIEIRYAPDSSRDIVIGDATELHELVTNLCANAIDAMEDNGGVVDVALKDIILGERDPVLGLDPGAYVRLTVRDTGCGIPAQHLEKIFDPFFTTKQAGKGTGLGLSIVSGIVKNHGGGISVDSREGRGTEVTVCLPMAPETAAAARPGARPKGLPLTGRRVLVVDDEDMVLETMRRALVTLGHKPTAVKNAAGAVEMFRTGPQDFDLAILDQTMPQMSGLELAAELKRIRPDLPVILITGYSKVVNDRSAHAAGVTEVVMKPLALHDLAAAVDRSLAAAGEKK